MPHSKFRFIIVCGSKSEARSSLIMHLLASRALRMSELSPDRLAKEFQHSDDRHDANNGHGGTFARYLSQMQRRLAGILSLKQDTAIIGIAPTTEKASLSAQLLEFLEATENKGVLLIDLDDTGAFEPNHPFHGKSNIMSLKFQGPATFERQTIERLILSMKPNIAA